MTTVICCILCIAIGWLIPSYMYYIPKIKKIQKKSEKRARSVKYWKDVCSRFKDQLTSKERFLLLTVESDAQFEKWLDNQHKRRWFTDIKNKILIKYYILRDKIIH